MSQLNIKSFLPHSSLSDKIWNKDETMKEDVRLSLLKIAQEFLNYLKVDVDVVDITMTGSYANYNYTKFSDIDLHIVIEFADLKADEDLVEGFMSAKRSYWNDTYDITVNGIEVELYPQDAQESHESSGVFSIENNSWVVKPQRFIKDPNVKSAKKKASMLKRQAKSAIGSNDLTEIERVIEKIKNMRKSGLEKSGEMSTENIAYKLLRAEDIIQDLYDSKFKAYSDYLSYS